ncbi:hypothetical protein CLAIMM_13672 [Cladophialophora immunda]|nr:hypothetical protein CLAIMM_13672 [Cladophialophora immunda]
MDTKTDSKQIREGEAVVVSEAPQEGDLYERRLSVTEWAKYRQTKRGLTPRHVQLMAIGGSIGTALFVGIGGSLKNAGPLSLVLGYLFWGLLFIWPSYLLVAEMLAWLPVRGTIFELAGRYVDPALGFAMGWTYFFAGAMLVCTEYASVATVMTYWNTSVNAAVWVTMALVVCVFFNLVAVRWYGESEFIMASTKILLLMGLILLTFITMVGGNPKHDAYGFRYWKHGLAMHPYYTTGATGRFLGFWSVVRYAAFTISGPDLISLAAGEIQNPRRTIPRAARLVFYRLVGFYVVGVLCVGIICSSRDARLISAINDGKAGSAASPWVLGIQNLGITGLPSFINALILLSGLSCGNAYLYSTSRTLYSLARDGQAPKFLMKCTKSGIPTYCVLVVTVISLITYLVASNAAAQGVDRNTLPYKAPFAPYTAYMAIVVGCVVMLFIGFDCFVPWSTQGFITNYFGLAYGIFMYFFWKVIKRTKFVDPKTCDIWSGKAEIDEECKIWEEGGFEEVEKARLAQMNIFRRTWEKIW